MKNLFKKIAILSIAMMVFGCSEDGATGANGANGINGTNGTNGNDGNANVFGATNVTTTSASWTPSGSGTFWNTTIQIPEITQAVYDKGNVSVFKKYNGGIWNTLPYSYNNESWNYGFFVGGVNIFCVSNSGKAINNPDAQTFRFVIINASN
ncbi:hypothetical protein ACFQZF_11160 [Flavobacterium myungsuense]|uniref:Collagen-like protein n=1 Tax=Flavobacterium myungsuense TaxID=651823 RepID=A0ABW3J0C3_9FLAO